MRACKRVAYLLEKLVHGDDVLQPGVVGGPLGEELVLDVDAGHARLLEGAHRVHGVHRLTVARVGVNDDRQRHRPHHPLGHRELLGHGHQRLGHRQVRAGDVAAAVDGVEAQRLHQPRRNGVVGSGGDNLLPGVDSGSEVSSYRHRYRLRKRKFNHGGH